jgi:RNA methyltransferase, trmH
LNVITSLDNEKVKMFKKLQKKKYRDEYNLFIVEGEHLAIEAFRAGVLEELILEEGTDLPFPSPYGYYSREVLSKISALDTPSSVMALCRKRDRDGEEVEGNRILVLDDIQDPGNLGTIIRSALAFGVTTIVLSEGTVDLYNPKVLRATQGMIFHTNIIVRNVYDWVRMIKASDFRVYGTCVDGGVDVKSLTPEDKEKIVLIVGNEGNGVKRRILDLCHENLYIKMNADVESLNVAVATSILLYELGN